ncbi:protein crumbs homolog 3-like [Myxocyprinus asiaticus]|uniref:protein crumbs homolog 3-like n=1 Tax=Myxocyprinus asiaticus TaxID=70543 RepID=UPI0022230496|nr:protein crumbs homolog 3-like [Myxocyprinus asiaticus]XP_051572471.1 protein crumbs homolog 3-like [Myxocyprinus asiaticus]
MRVGVQTDSVSGMIQQVGLLAGSILPLLLRNALANETTTMSSNTTTTTPSQGPNIVAIVVPTVVLGLLAILTAVLVFLFCVVKKKRQTEGTYRPSAEEQTGTSSVETPDALKLPKEERLI